MEPDPGDQDEQMSLGSDQEPLEGPQEGTRNYPDPPGTRSPPRSRGWTERQRGSHGQEEGEQPMDCQPEAVPEEILKGNEGQDRARPNTHNHRKG